MGPLGAGGKPIDDEIHVLRECQVSSQCRLRFSAGQGAFRLEVLSEVERFRYIAECMDLVEQARIDQMGQDGP